MFTYTHIFRGDESKAVADLPDLSLPSKEEQKAITTGTDDGPKWRESGEFIFTKSAFWCQYRGSEREYNFNLKTLITAKN